MQLVQELGQWFWADLNGRRLSPLFKSAEAARDWEDGLYDDDD